MLRNFLDDYTDLEHVYAALIFLKRVIDKRKQVLESLVARDSIHQVEEGLCHLRGTLLDNSFSSFGIGGTIEPHYEFEILLRDNLRPVSKRRMNARVRKAPSRNQSL